MKIPQSTISLSLKPDILSLKTFLEKDPKKQEIYKGLTQLMYEEVARITRECEEVLSPEGNHFVLTLTALPKSKSFLALDLRQLAKTEYSEIKQLLHHSWQPTSEDLKKETYPIQDWSKFQSLPPFQKRLQLVLYAPSLTNDLPKPGFKANSIYVIAKDLEKILQRSQQASPEEQNKTKQDFKDLCAILHDKGFIGYRGNTYPLAQEWKDDYIFESSDFYLPLLLATREHFSVKGSKQFAILELSDLRERIATLNHIESKIHESLLQWRDDYNQSKMDPSSQLSIPKPTKNVYWNNFLLSCKKYFRGDERKTLQWGLDLLGGKTVQIALKDTNNRLVTQDSDIKQAINELFSRVNKMGVSDVNIRQEGSNITLDFPGLQNISATELIKASSMTFHIVNEAFSPHRNPSKNYEINQFLQEIWNEASLTGQKDIDSINQIAWSHLYGESLDPQQPQPKTDAAKSLYRQGLRLANPLNPDTSGLFNDTLSKIAMYQGDTLTNWHGQTHPLLIVFKNYALEGSHLEQIRSGYDPTKGNFLSFSVKGSQTLPNGQKQYPQKTLYAWTNTFAKDKISGTPYEAYGKGFGWRMAVILNGAVISAPNLESSLKESGMITGHFTQREINQLVSDLKAGSLTFTPQILSEKTISPELGLKERAQGILATIIALVSVIILMIGYYRFGGLIASIAVIFNLLILWAALQNMGASITLPGLAGIILTVGMAVDANVLVFERIREEFEKTKKLAYAVQAGYKKAFSAIIDSNVTTIIAGLILLHFDSGPIKGFAITLIIGIVSSLFTALFVTRYFFIAWVKKSPNKPLKMAHLIPSKPLNFLKQAKVFTIVGALFIAGGLLSLGKTQKTILGIDFTGGFALNIECLKETTTKTQIEKALLNKGFLSFQDFHIRELGAPNQLRIFFAKSMNLKGKPFYKMPSEISIPYPTYSYETNPKLVWLVTTLKASGIELTPSSLETLDQNWRNISGQMSHTMKTNAIFGLILACISILAYITFRFEFSYAISATLGLLFDLLMTISILSILHLLGMNIQIDLNTIAAFMTIIGYSLNDTIIVFDRIRETVEKKDASLSFKHIVNQSLNETLSRTLLTSATTLIALLSLVLLGGKTLFSFSFIMTIGVLIGTLSTFFVASTFLLFFQRHEKQKKDSDPFQLNGTS